MKIARTVSKGFTLIYTMCVGLFFSYSTDILLNISRGAWLNLYLVVFLIIPQGIQGGLV